MLRCKARKNRSARRIWKYVERFGLQSNAADKRFSTAPKGFTLVELITAIAVLAVITVIAGMNLHAYTLNKNLKSAARDIAADFFRCKQRAVSESTTYRISFDVAGGSYTIQPGTSAAVIKRPSSFGSGIALDSVRFGGGQTVSFLTRGTLSPFGNVILKNSRDSKATIRVNITGRTYVRFDIQ